MVCTDAMAFGDDPTASQPTAGQPTVGPPTLPPPVPPGYPSTPPPFHAAGGWAGGSPRPLSTPPSTPRPASSPDSGPRRGRGPRVTALVVGLLVAGFLGGLGAGAVYSRVSNTTDVPTAQQFPTQPTPPVERSVPSTTIPDPGPSGGGQLPTDPTDPSGGYGGSGPYGGSRPSGPGSNPSQGGSQGGLSSTDAAAVADKVTPGVVDINTVTGRGEGAGTGMVLTASGRVLTNNHVIAGATRIVATDVDTGKQYNAEVVGTDPTDDVAVIQLKGASGLGTVHTGDSTKVATGDPVVAVGNAGGRGGLPTVVSGDVVATGQEITVTDETGQGAEHLTGLIQIDAPIEPGDSGGPLANTDGEVVGINTAASADSVRGLASGEGYAIPINSALRIAKQIVAGDASGNVHVGVRGVLGVNVDPSATRSGGAAVVDVASGSGAESAGVTAGSVITSLDGKDIGSADALTSAIGGHKPGDKVELGWTDGDGATHTATVTMGEGPPD